MIGEERKGQKGEEERERRGEVVGRAKVASRNCLTNIV